MLPLLSTDVLVLYGPYMVLDLHEVARVYAEAAKTSQRPVQIVAETLNITPAYASSRVTEARRRGILAPTAKRRIGMNPRIIAIAEELGIDPAALRDALIRHSAPSGHIGFGYHA